MIREVVVIGGGASGLAASIAAKKRNKDVLLIERENELGGILNQCIHNGFGLEVFKEEYTGPEYAYKFIQDFKSNNIDCMLNTTVIKLEKEKDLFIITLTSSKAGLETIKAKSVIISSGCYERTRGQISMPGDRPIGVITAGSAQRYLNMNGYMVGKKVFILGSGDIGLIMARRMHLEGAEVLGVAEIMAYSNGLNRNIVQCLNDFDIPLFLSHTVTNVEADEFKRLKAITIQQVDESFIPIVNTEKRFEVDALLLSIGLIPDITLLDDLNVEVDSRTKSAKINQAYETSVSGLFICGNSLQVHDLVDNVSKESQRAGEAAADFIENINREKKQINIINGKNILYVTPQHLDFGWNHKDLNITFRSTKKLEKAVVKVYQGDSLIYQKRRSFIVPAEMETISFAYKDLSKEQDIVLELEEM
ncbi:MAG: NAD(P)/FAD-dependent oxidoreductase [Candidatus Izemoplasmatales bacterium]|nr:NAD(P)/FAD-dependent oxidoreductase [Candidatus Izemoplasmatales bacterium]